jgi:hypothetical protein
VGSDSLGSDSSSSSVSSSKTRSEAENLDVVEDGKMATGAEVPAGEEFLRMMGSAVTRAVFTVEENKSPKVGAGKGPRMGGRELCRHTACRAGLAAGSSGESGQAGNNAGSGNEDSGVSMESESSAGNSGVSRLMGVTVGPAAEDSGVSTRSETDAVIRYKASWEDSGVSKQSEVFALIMSGASGAIRGAESEELWYCPVDGQRGFKQVILSSAAQDGSETLSGDFTREGSIHGDEARRKGRGDQGGGAAQVHDHGDPPAVGARLHTTGGMKSV